MADTRYFAKMDAGTPVEDRPALAGHFVYLVEWPDGVIKAGYASHRRRWRSHVCRGGELTLLLKFESQDEAFDAEDALHDQLSQRFPRAFHSRDEALSHLSGGSGYLECYQQEGTNRE